MNARAHLGADELAQLDRDETAAVYRRSIVAASNARSALAQAEAFLRFNRLTNDADVLSRRVAEQTAYIGRLASRLAELREGAAV